MKKTIGILGGMGPEATSFFFNQLIKRTKAAEDQEHIKVIIYNNPEIPPRTDAILGNGPSPLPYLIEGVRMLHQAGADFIVMPCVTAHYYYNDIIAKEKVSFLIERYAKKGYINPELWSLAQTTTTRNWSWKRSSGSRE